MASSRFRTPPALSLTVAVLVGLPFAIVARGGGRFSGDTPRFRLWGQASQHAGQQSQFDQVRALPPRQAGQEQAEPECRLRVERIDRGEGDENKSRAVD
jgi:hypothetical protein